MALPAVPAMAISLNRVPESADVDCNGSASPCSVGTAESVTRARASRQSCAADECSLVVSYGLASPGGGILAMWVCYSGWRNY